MKQFQIYNANAFKQIEEYKQQNMKVNHIITDPPYNISKSNNFHTMQNERKGVDFGKWDYDFDLFSWIKPYADILENGGSFIIFNSFLNLSFIAKELENAGLEIKDCLKWIKTNPMPRNIERRYVQDTEFAIWAVKSKAKWVFNKPKDKKYLRAEFSSSVVSGKEKVNHPTQKSLKVMSEIIQIHTNENDLILDPFMGSGTTGVAALQNNRKFLGIELEKEYFEIAKNRLEAVQRQNNLF